MIELIALAGAGAGSRVLVARSNVPGTLYRQMETLRLLSRKMVADVSDVRPGDTRAIDAWLEKHAGTTDLSELDRQFFAEQLRVAQREVGEN